MAVQSLFIRPSTLAIRNRQCRFQKTGKPFILCSLHWEQAIEGDKVV